MAGVIHKLSPFQNVGANLTAVLPEIARGGFTYENILLKLGGTAFTKAMITGIRLTLGGKVIWDVTGAHLDDLNDYVKRGTNVAYLPLWFANPNARDISGYLAGAIDTSFGYKDFSLEVDIGGATAPTLEAYALKSGPIDRSQPYAAMVRTLKKSAHAPSSAAEHDLKIPVGGRQGALIRALHFFHANITKLQVTKDSFNLLQEGVNAVNQFYQGELYRTVQAGLVSWDPTYQDDDRDAVPTLVAPGVLSAFEFKVTVSAADAITAYSDLLQTVEGV